MPGRTFVRFDHQALTPAELVNEARRASDSARLDRRVLLQAAIGMALAAATGTAGAAAQGGTRSADAALAKLLQRTAENELRRSPEEATGLEFDTGANTGLRSRLDDRSLPAIADHRHAVDATRTQLARIDRSSLSAAAQLDYDVAVFVYATLADQLGRYGFVDLNLRPSPYVVSQMNGAYYWLPDFLGSRHPLRSREDLDAYYARLSALATAIDQETERVRHDASLGVLLPSFTLATTLAQLQSLRATPAAQTAAIGPAIRRAADAGLGDISDRSAQIYSKLIVPALSRQIDALRTLQDKAVDDAGVWSLPDGEAYYASALLSNTTTRTSATELHEQGLELVKELTSQLDQALRAEGYTDGAVVTRVDALNRDRRYLVADDDAGRERLLAAARAVIDKIRAKLPAGFKTIPNDPLEVRRIAPAIESGAPGAYYSEGAAGAAATFSLNLKAPVEMPLWRLPTLAHHEGIPGHHFQYSVLRAAGELSLFRRLVRFSAYTEGWALYAERVADELGVYRDDAAGRIGLLQSELFRAGRIVVDTGIHARRWPREQAIRWMIENVGEQPSAAQREIDRYCVYPGQACSFMVGATQIRAARERTRQRLGTRFDVRDFHDLILRSGPVPLDLLHAMAQLL
ncbi:MAG TPA: DUF885 family protein [Steroidobacteraceae bacterium]|nr:DUF885 family protein [Steroidobacteraceae bacterium]